ncbi:HFX_2341 family transcriptional regulator domain-containing protein [Archaeoglobus sp.]
MKTVHLIPLGNRCEVVLDSVKMSGKPIQKAYLIVSREDNCLEDVVNALKNFIEVEVVKVSNDVYGASMELLKIIKRELDEGNEVYINISDAPRELCIASLISAQISRTKIYMAITSNGRVKRVIDLKVPPVKSVGDDKIVLIRALEENGGEVESINGLIEIVEGKINDPRRYMAQRARMSYHLKGLEEDGLIEMKREGKNVRIRLTPLGKAYAIMILK